MKGLKGPTHSYEPGTRYGEIRTGAASSRCQLGHGHSPPQLNINLDEAVDF